MRRFLHLCLRTQENRASICCKSVTWKEKAGEIKQFKAWHPFNSVFVVLLWMNTLHHHRSLAWALFHAHSLPRLVFPMGMLTHLQLDCPVNIQKPRLPHCKMLVHLYFGSFTLVKMTFAFFLLLLISRCIYESSIIYSPGSPYHKLPSNHLQFHKCSVLICLNWAEYQLHK